jgi:ABC-2 type transport system permease protein
MNATILGFVRKEVLQTLRDPRMRIVLFAAPILQLTLFGVAISNEVKNIRLAAVFEPRDEVSRHIWERSLSSRWFVPAKTEGSDPFEWVRSGQAEAVFIAPGGTLSKAVERGEGGLQLLINAKNVIRAQAIENYIQAIASRVVEPPNLGAAMRPQPLRFDVRPLYNPTLETSVYMVPGVMSMLVCIATILLTSMGIAREKEMGTLEMLISAPVRPIEVILGKTLPYMMIGMVQIPLIVTAAVLIFGIPLRGPIYLLAGSAVFYVLTTVSVGLLISTLARNQQQAMLGGLLFLFPAILMSGLMFPLENMPLPMWLLAQLNPITHFVALLRNIMLKGGDFVFFLRHTAALAAIGGVLLTVGIRQFRTRL